MLRHLWHNVAGCEDQYIIDLANEVRKILGVYEDGKSLQDFEEDQKLLQDFEDRKVLQDDEDGKLLEFESSLKAPDSRTLVTASRERITVR
jgi:hypothetical protein